MTRLRFYCAALAASLLTTTAGAGTIHVPAEQPTIQAGIDAASAGDTVLVACGLYEGDIDMKSGVHLKSETGQPECVTVDFCTITCDGVDSATVIEGITITRGDGIYGGGMYCKDSDPQLVSVTFHLNTASSFGGGIYCEDSSPSLSGVVFSNNHAEHYGGGMACWRSSATFSDVRFVDNFAVFRGGGLYCINSDLTLTNTLLADNRAARGGGMHVSGEMPILDGVMLLDNHATSGGGGILCDGATTALLQRCTLAGNTSPGGAAVQCDNSTSPHLENCIVAFNLDGAAVFCEWAGEPALSCCDVFGNEGGDWVGCIEGQNGNDGNFSEDPLFCGNDNPEEPYTLRSDSPCAGENNPECGQIGTLPVGCEAASFAQEASWGAIKALYR